MSTYFIEIESYPPLSLLSYSAGTSYMQYSTRYVPVRHVTWNYIDRYIVLRDLEKLPGFPGDDKDLGGDSLLPIFLAQVICDILKIKVDKT